MFGTFQKTPQRYFQITLLFLTFFSVGCAGHNRSREGGLLPSWLYQRYEVREGFEPVADQYFLREINRQRAAKGLVLLQPYFPYASSAGLSPAAQWARRLSREQRLIHSRAIEEGLPLVKDGGRIGENVGRGFDPALIMAAFMKSRSHRQNLLHPDYRYLVTATYRNFKGQYYTCHRFISDF